MGFHVITADGSLKTSVASIDLTTDVNGVLPIANGGSNSGTALSGSSIIISDGSKIVQGTAGTATTLLHGNAAGAPTYSAASLTADVTGTLPVANGGTGIATLTANRIPYGNGTSAFQSAAGFTFDGTTLTIPGQIAFPGTQAASAGANTLDDYEEGTWTPVIGGIGGTSGQAYSTQSGHYIKVGLQVLVWFRADLSTEGTITSSAQIQGFPFTVENVASQRAFMPFFFDGLAVNKITVGGLLIPNTTTATVYGLAAAAATLTALTATDISDTTLFTGCLMYRTTA